MAEDYSKYITAMGGGGGKGGSGDEQTAKSHAEANQNFGGIGDGALGGSNPLVLLAVVAIGVAGFIGVIFLVTKLK